MEVPERVDTGWPDASRPACRNRASHGGGAARWRSHGIERERQRALNAEGCPVATTPPKAGWWRQDSRGQRSEEVRQAESSSGQPPRPGSYFAEAAAGPPGATASANPRPQAG